MKPLSEHNYFRRVENTMSITEDRKKNPLILYRKDKINTNKKQKRNKSSENKNKTLNDSSKLRKKKLILPARPRSKTKALTPAMVC